MKIEIEWQLVVLIVAFIVLIWVRPTLYNELLKRLIKESGKPSASASQQQSTKTG